MSQTTVRINETTHALLKELSKKEHTSMQLVLEHAVEEYRRRKFLEDVNAGYAAARADPGTWAEIEAERAAWDQTLGDGLPDEHWTEDAKPAPRPKKGRRA